MDDVVIASNEAGEVRADLVGWCRAGLVLHAQAEENDQILPDAAGHPQLDVRTIPHAIRQATIFGALDGVRHGQGLVLVAPHDPRPLLAQLERREPGAFDVDYLERGPGAWRLLIVRTAG